MYRVLVALAATLVVAAAAWAQPPVREPVREGNMERLVLDDGLDADAATWVPAECSITVDNKRAKHGDTSLRMHIDVNWETGEKAYPIGWPRANRTWPEAVQDWSQYDFFEFSIYVESSRDKLPATPMGMTLYDKDKKKNYSRSLTDLPLGQWMDYRIPVADLKRTIPCTGIQFHISESEYKHGDVLDFWIDNISVTRFTEPTISASKLAEEAITTGSRYVTVDLNLMGVKADQTAEVVWQLATAGKSTATGKITALPGKNRYYLTLPPKGLALGLYDLTLKCGGNAPTKFSLIVTPSPWEEK